MVQKSGNGVPIQQYLSHDAYLHAVSAALAAELGAGGGATKTVMRWSNVSERTARNWLGAEKAPGGRHLIMLARHSPLVWRSIQELSGHQHAAMAVPASTQARDAVAAAADAIAATMPRSGWKATDEAQNVLSSTFWLPTCPRPDLLYRVYCGTIGDMLLSNSRMLGENDLAFLEPPAGLSERNFDAFIGAMLRQVRWIQDLDQQTTQGLTDNDAATTIAASLPAHHDFSPGSLWNVTKDWLMHFFPHQYDRVPAGEMLRKRWQII
jgi:hypothetical protein